MSAWVGAVTALVVVASVAPAAGNPIPFEPERICLPGGLCVRRTPPPPPPPPPARELAQDVAPPSPDAIPAWQTFGFRAGFRQLTVVGEDRQAFDIGLAWAAPLAGHLLAFTEYDFLFLSARSSPMGPAPHGRGHAFTAGARFPLVTTLIGRVRDSSGALRPHVDLELGGTALLVSDDQLGTHGGWQGLAGVRLGLEMVRVGDGGGLRRAPATCTSPGASPPAPTTSRGPSPWAWTGAAEPRRAARGARPLRSSSAHGETVTTAGTRGGRRQGLPPAR
ncbi:MAG: hypothetical protein R3B06_16290 [Kofleriaceae bacterium]